MEGVFLIDAFIPLKHFTEVLQGYFFTENSCITREVPFYLMILLRSD